MINRQLTAFDSFRLKQTKKTKTVKTIATKVKSNPTPFPFQQPKATPCDQGKMQN